MAAENGTRNTGGRRSGERMTNQPKGRSMDGGYGKDREGVGRQEAGGYGSGKRPGTGTQRSGSRNMGRKKKRGKRLRGGTEQTDQKHIALQVNGCDSKS